MMDSPFDVFIGVWIALIAASVLASLGDLLFWRAMYAFGIRVLSQAEPTLQLPSAPVGTVFETANGKFKVVDPGLVLMRQRYGPMRSRVQVRGRIIWEGGMPRVEARLPWMTVIAPVVMIVALTVIGPAGDDGFLAIFVLIVLGVTAVNAFMSRRQASMLMGEYREHSGILGLDV